MTRAAKYIALLGIFLAAVSAVAGAVATQRFGSGSYVASAVAALLVWMAGSLSLGLVASAKTPHGRLNAILAGVIVRMALPLVAVLYFANSTHPLSSGGIAGLIVVHYLAGLIVETLLAVRMIGQLNASSGAGGRIKVPAANASSRSSRV